MEFKIFCKEQKIIMLYMLSYLSYILQPLDIRYFRLLKKAYSKEIKGLIRANIIYITKANFLPVFSIAFKAIITKENIQEAFRGIELILFNLKSILLRLDAQLQTLIQVKKAVKLLNLQVLKTLNNLIKVTLQTNYIKR